jgi:hypothetical protein
MFLVIFYRDKFVFNRATFSSGHCEGVEFIGRCVLTAQYVCKMDLVKVFGEGALQFYELLEVSTRVWWF